MNLVFDKCLFFRDVFIALALFAQVLVYSNTDERFASRSCQHRQNGSVNQFLLVDLFLFLNESLQYHRGTTVLLVQ